MKEGEADEHTRREATEAEAAETETLRVKAVQDAEALAQAAAEGGPQLKWTRRPAKPKFEGLIKPEDLEAIDTEEHEIGRRIDAILAAADAISERFEQSHEGRIRGDETPIAIPGEIPPPAENQQSVAPARNQIQTRTNRMRRNRRCPIVWRLLFRIRICFRTDSPGKDLLQQSRRIEILALDILEIRHRPYF